MEKLPVMMRKNEKLLRSLYYGDESSGISWFIVLQSKCFRPIKERLFLILSECQYGGKEKFPLSYFCYLIESVA